MAVTPYRAEKVGGSYQAIGTVLTEFTNSLGFQRCVFEFDQPRGMMHIFSIDQVRRLPLPDED